MKRSYAWLSLAVAAMTAAACNLDMNLLVGTYGEALYEYTYNERSRTFTEQDAVPAINASYLTIKDECLYAVSENGAESGVYSFERDSLGKWTRTAFVKGCGADPCYIYATDQAVLTADYSGGSLSAFIVDNGRVEGCYSRMNYAFIYGNRAPVPARQEKAHIHQVKRIAIGGNYYYLVSDLGNDCIHVLDKGLESVDEIPCGFGTGPRHMEYSASAHALYCISELSGEVISWRVRDVEGTPEFIDMQRILADEFHAQGSADIHLSPDGRFLYTSHRLKNDGICIFSVNREGYLKKVGYRNTGAHPRNFVITPDGRQMLVACRDNKSVEVYKINRKTGELSDCRSRLEFENDAPVCLVIY